MNTCEKPVLIFFACLYCGKTPTIFNSLSPSFFPFLLWVFRLFHISTALTTITTKFKYTTVFITSPKEDIYAYYYIKRKYQ